ncbi:hypothetical protein A4G26_01235 [Mycobacterium kansasii]|nr:hypothetical protein A4G26_01235 [Mycobacterium kansasii]KZS74690.1 hypothetical protein A4G29_24710 [Mycobacterium kansasii]
MQVFSELFSDRPPGPIGPQTASRSSAATATPRLSPAPSTNLLDHPPVEILAEQRRPVGVA